MSPRSQCMLGGDPPPQRVFMQRLMHEVPSLQAALALYHTTKEHHYVGTALLVAEAGASVVASTTLPLAQPLLHRIGGWGTLDQWACWGLDHVEAAAPIITLPTGEVVSRTRDLMLSTLAGGGKDQPLPPPPPTLTAALATRALNTARVVADTQAGMAVVGAANNFLDTAHTILDKYLPPEKCDHIILDYDGRGGTFGMRVEALLVKGRRRMKSSLCNLLHVNHCHPLQPDDLAITSGHLVELGRRAVVGWYLEASHRPYIGKIVQGAMAASSLALGSMSSTQFTIIKGVKTFRAMVTEAVEVVHSIVFSSPAESVVTTGMGVVRKLGNNAMGMVERSVAVVTGIVRGSVVVMKGGMLVANDVVRCSVREVRKKGMDVVKSGAPMALGGINEAKELISSTSKITIVVLTNMCGAVQCVVVSVITGGKSLGKHGMNMGKSVLGSGKGATSIWRNVWHANGGAMLKVTTTGQIILSMSKSILQGNGLVRTPVIVSCLNMQHQHQHPKTPFPQQHMQDTETMSKMQDLPTADVKVNQEQTKIDTMSCAMPKSDLEKDKIGNDHDAGEEKVDENGDHKSEKGEVNKITDHDTEEEKVEFL